jgi:hypothetical protein
LTGLACVFFLHHGTAKLVRILDLFPSGDPVAAVVYRSLYVVVGSYITARLAPLKPMGHALVLGGIELVLISVSANYLVPMQFFGPAWYYYWLALTALPCAWLGGILHTKFHR